MPGGYTGTILEVDLTTRKVTKKEVGYERSQDVHRRRAWAPNGCGTAPSRGEVPLLRIYPLMLLSGPLNGLPSPSTSRLTIVTKSGTTFPSQTRRPRVCCTPTWGAALPPR